MRGRGLRLISICAAAALLLAGVAFAAGSEETVVGSGGFTAGGTVTPKGLPKEKPGRAVLTLEGRWLGASLPPALSELEVELDRFVTFDLEGLPVCRFRDLQIEGAPPHPAGCRDAVVGNGVISTQLPASAGRITVKGGGETTFYNGGVDGRVISLLFYAHLARPIGGAIAGRAKIRPIANGRYGLRLTATAPQIAGGAGLVTGFKFKLDKRFQYGGERRSFVNARCPDGKLQVAVTARFADGTDARSEFVRPCTRQR